MVKQKMQHKKEIGIMMNKWKMKKPKDGKQNTGKVTHWIKTVNI